MPIEVDMHLGVLPSEPIIYTESYVVVTLHPT